MCENCSACFSDGEKKKLADRNWTKEQIDFAENSIIENKIKEMLK